MDSIRKGTTLKVMTFELNYELRLFFFLWQKIDPAALSTGSGGSGSGGDSRTDLLSEIRQGFELRPAANRDLGAERDTNGTDALADALRRALQERGRVLRSSDEGGSEESDDGEWDD